MVQQRGKARNEASSMTFVLGHAGENMKRTKWWSIMTTTAYNVEDSDCGHCSGTFRFTPAAHYYLSPSSLPLSHYGLIIVINVSLSSKVLLTSDDCFLMNFLTCCSFCVNLLLFVHSLTSPSPPKSLSFPHLILSVDYNDIQQCNIFC